MIAAVQKLLLVSDYACKHVDILKLLLLVDDCKLPIDNNGYFQLLDEFVLQASLPFARALRQFRNYHFLRLLLRELAGLAGTEETMASWSNCADAIILRSMGFCQQELAARFGDAIEESGKPAQLYVLAMGKLGGCELNYSSDIDLIIAFSAAGHTNGAEQVSNEYFYTKVVQAFIKLLQTLTPDGFVFRVDLRLRPNGDSGALVSSLATMETYYQEQGRDWERYAMVKARLLREPSQLCDSWFQQLITPFVYHRYVDFSVIESLRSMKKMIEREVLMNPRLDDIKRGSGGIREIEFIIQNIQLIRGGRLSGLRHQNAMAALETIQQEKLLSHAKILKQVYLFLRKLENCLQSENDQQTHSLPADASKQAAIYYAMGFESWNELTKKLLRIQKIVNTMFRLILGKVDYYEDSERLLSNQLTLVWQGHVENTMAVNLLASLGYQEAERCYQILHAFRNAPRCRRLTQAARMRLDRFMVLLLRELIAVDDTATVLLEVIHLLENIVGRSAYLALLTENPHALKELLYWFARSTFITSLIVGNPFLLETLLEREPSWQPTSRSQLEQQLQNQLLHCDEQELQEEMLRQFKLTNWLLAARAEMRHSVSAVRIGRFLADVADVIVSEIITLACQQLAQKYPDIMSLKPQFAIFAYGKLGSREMNYNSDLDLVFVHSLKSDREGLVTRLTQKIMHMLTTRLRSGVLYQVDTRLRPSGEAGLLVSSLNAFAEYQQTKAWVWEHQALTRSRVLFGSKPMRRVFRQLKQSVLHVERDKQVIANDILDMQEKIIQHLGNNSIKYLPGGLLALEFLVQFLVLVNPQVNFSRCTNTGRFLHLLANAGVINFLQFQMLLKAYKLYHHILHTNVLQPGKQIDWTREQATVQSVCKELMTRGDQG